MNPMTPHTTWVLLRGLTRERGHWGDFPNTLARALPPSHRVLTLDMAGNGHRHLERSPSRVEDMAQDLRQQLHAAGHAPPYNVLAMSLGAMVTVAWADAHPQEIQRCVLVNTSLRPHSPLWHRLRPKQWPRIAGLLCGASPLQWEEAILAMTSQRPAPAALLARHLALRSTHPVSTRNGLRQLWAAVRYRAPARPPSASLLMLSGARDALVNPQCTRTLARLWHSVHRQHPTAGHDLPLDDADWVAHCVSQWLDESTEAQSQGAD